MNKNKKIIIGGIAGIVAVTGICTGVYAYNEYNAYELKTDCISIELGSEPDMDTTKYVMSNDKAVEGTELDFTQVDTSKAGTYTATAEYKDNKLEFTVEVKDTTAPTVELANAGTYKMMVGETLQVTDVVTKSEDLAGIQSVSFADEAASLTYDTDGTYSNRVTVIDANGNKTDKNISVRVVEDYEKHVSGFKDWTVETNAAIDFTQGIVADERIASVTPGTATVDMSKAGEYTLTYDIAGDDNETVIQKSVKVTVVDAATSQTMANDGATVYVSGNAVKEKEVKPVVVATNEPENTGNNANNNTSDVSAESGVREYQIADEAGSPINVVETEDGKVYNGLKEGASYDFGEPIDSFERDGSVFYGYETRYFDKYGNPLTEEEVRKMLEE